MGIRVSMMLADSAQAVQGKLYILGAGWNMTGPEPNPSAIAAYVEVSWDMANQRHHWRLELLDSDGQLVEVPGPEGDQALQIMGEFEVGRPPGVLPGSGLGFPMAINLGPIELDPGSRYVWQLWVNDETDANWRLPFTTRSAAMLGQEPMISSDDDDNDS